MILKMISAGTVKKEPDQYSSVMSFRQNAGFSMVEIVLVIMLAGVLAGFAVINMAAVIPGLNANKAMYQAIAQLRHGRQQAIAQRRSIQLNFLDDNQIQLVRNEFPNGETELKTVLLTNNCRFIQPEGVYEDTPDSFGNSSALDFGGADSLTFLSDGTLVDESGNPVNGSMFIGLPGRPDVARAVTILGATGRVRSYRWNGEEWRK